MQVEVNPCPDGHLHSSSRHQYTELEDAAIFGCGVQAKGLSTASEEGHTGSRMKEGTLRQDFCRSVPASRSCWGG